MVSADPTHILSLFLMAFLMSTERVNSHGYMYVPPMRSSMWRHKFPVPANYDDNALFCGGTETQNVMNQGRCGECGDNWATPRPRPNEEGGKFGLGIIAANYTQGQVIDVQITITMNHGGFFEFRLCADKTSANQLSTDECFDKNLLEFENGSTRYILGAGPGGPNGPVNLRLRLPAGVSCQYCVLQWWWKTASNQNYCGNNVGCGKQEQYKNCADIAIASNGQSPSSTLSTTTASTTTTQEITAQPPTTPRTTTRFPPCFGRTTCVDTTTTSTTTTAPPPPPTFVCPLTNGYYPDRNACNAYYQCTSGFANRGTCPPPFYFDSATRFCHLPFIGSGCDSRPFICPSDGFHQIPGTSCTSSFYYCFKDVVYEMFCPSGFVFNPPNGRCEAASNIPGC